MEEGAPEFPYMLLGGSLAGQTGLSLVGAVRPGHSLPRRAIQ